MIRDLFQALMPALVSITAALWVLSLIFAQALHSTPPV
jgi:hypothetical protein